MSDTIIVRPADAGDAAQWKNLWAQYLEFYQSEIPGPVTDATWKRIIDQSNTAMGGLVAQTGSGDIAAFINFVIHPNTWSLEPVCYLEDLFVAPDQRGTGLARALIEHLAATGRLAGWARIYWHTARDNVPAQ
ncbi:MAG: GNAT family N-acetyltransferase, partial [Alphaproteobacteria bacterium]